MDKGVSHSLSDNTVTSSSTSNPEAVSVTTGHQELVSVASTSRRRRSLVSCQTVGRIFLFLQLIPVFLATVFHFLSVDVPMTNQNVNGSNISGMDSDHAALNRGPCLNPTSANVNVSCHPDLVLDDKGNCVLPCASWTWIPADEELLYTVLAYFDVVVLLSGGILITIVWLRLYRSLWKFPHIVSWYVILTASVSAICKLSVMAGGSDSFLCDQTDALQIADDPSVKCIIYGAVNIYLTLATFAWWTFFVCNMCWVISNPMKAQCFFTKAQQIHWIQLAIGWLLPAVLVAIGLLVDGKYVAELGRNNETCEPRSKWISYFTMLLPVQLSILTVIVFLLCAGQKLFEAETFRIEMASMHSSTTALTEDIEFDHRVQEIRALRLKFSLMAHVYPLCMSWVMIHLSLKRMYSETVIYYVREYYQCLLSSPCGTQDCPKQYLDYQYPQLAIISAVCIQLLYVMIIVFALSLPAARKELWNMTKRVGEQICCNLKQVKLSPATSNDRL